MTMGRTQNEDALQVGALGHLSLQSIARARAPARPRKIRVCGLSTFGIQREQAAMINPDSDLDRILAKRKLGTRLDETLAPPPFDRIFRHHKKVWQAYLEGLESLRVGAPYGVWPCYTNSTHLNAAAIRTPAGYWIAFPFGTLSLLYDLFFRMLGTDAVFPEFGKADPDGVPKYDWVPTDAAELIAEAGNPIGVNYIPPDRKRRALAEYLVVIVSDILFAHEYQHIDGGHLHFLNGSPLSSIVEFGDGPKTYEEALVRQALEVDADAASVRWSLKITMAARRNQWRYDRELRSYLLEPEMALRTWMFALITLYRLSHETDRPSSDLFSAHPSPLMRLAFMRPMMDYLLSSFPIKMDPLSMFEVVFDEVQHGLCAVSNKLPRREGFSSVNTREFRDHMNAVVSVWRKIRPELNAISTAWGGDNAPEAYLPYVESVD
jgi:hypothetical protein